MRSTASRLLSPRSRPEGAGRDLKRAAGTAMAAQLGREQQGITLRGSAEIVAEFFSYGINSILYQRGIYPPETFTRVQKYGLTLLVTTDPELKNYLNNVVEQMKEWLYKCTVQRLVVVISSIENNEVLERWQFDIECDKSAKGESAPRDKSQKAIQDEIRSVIRQITATVTFLPLLETACAFDLLIYTDKDLVVPEKWEESGPQFIANSEELMSRKRPEQMKHSILKNMRLQFWRGCCSASVCLVLLQQLHSIFYVCILVLWNKP
uniref:Mitotic spindle assembly checkpoint protein MAD2A n=1 Tax=Coturnix japonica TaxID=93934 RepID=A0A8C2SUM4_COTJA